MTDTRAGLGLALVCAVLGLVAFAAWQRLAPDPSPDPPFASEAELPSVDRIAVATLTRCPDAADPEPIGGELQLRVFIGPGVDPVRAKEATSAVQRYYSVHGVDLELADRAQLIPHASMFVADFATLEQLEQLEQLDRDRARARARAIYRELRTFMHTHANAPSDPSRSSSLPVNLVLVRDIVHPRAAAASILGDLVGLTLAPSLLHTNDDDNEALAPVLAALELDSDFIPTVFLSDRHLEHMSDAAFVGTVAHELGHALGLAHDPRPTNLMARGEHACVPGLDAAQLDQLRAAVRG